MKALIYVALLLAFSLPAAAQNIYKRVNEDGVVEFSDRPRRISRGSVRFFLNWTNERIKRVKLVDAQQRNSVLKYHHEAKSFWEDRLKQANVD